MNPTDCFFRKPQRNSILLCALILGVTLASPRAHAIEPPVAVPAASAIDSSAANLSLKKDLDRRHESLRQRFEKWNADATAFNGKYGGRDFKDGSAEAAAGLAARSRLSKALKNYESDAGAFKADVARLRLKKDVPDSTPVTATTTGTSAPDSGEPLAKTVPEIIDAMNALARRLGWSEKEQTRLNLALRKLKYEGADSTVGEIRKAWQDVLDRGPDSEFAREASAGRGPGFPSAGKQGGFEDCAVFALANAASQPYGVVAARAGELMRMGEWRSARDRTNPQAAIEGRGLTGGEVVMLAEALGQAEVFPSKEFPRVLSEGRTVLLNVVPSDGTGSHEIVLTKTFQHAGETWYEMINSHQGPQRRLYLSAAELSIMQQENGVAFRNEPHGTPKLLRD